MAAPTGADRRLSALDAAFLYLERAGQLLHVAGVYTVDGRLDFERQKTDLLARLHLIPRYTQRVVHVPFNLAHPTWEPDPTFDIQNHVVRHVLRPPGDDHQLVNLVSRLFARQLDRARPLWELHQIDGYQGGRTAIFCKVHHAMIDGVSGVQLLGVLFDPSPNPAPPPPAPTAEDVPPLPSASRQLIRGVQESLRAGVDRCRAVIELVRHPRRALEEIGIAADALTGLGKTFLATTPSTPFNGRLSSQRRVAWATMSLNEMKAVKNRLGGTLNDVVLATITAALRRYLEEHGHSPERTELRAVVPVNLRTPDEHLKLGNRVSMMVAPLPVGILDPRERVRQIRGAMALLKDSGDAKRMSRVLELMDFVPPALQRPIGWLQMQAAPINTICTNVPGPPVSLFAQGKRLATLVPLVPLADGIGLGFAILTYADTITIGISADPSLVPDSERLRHLLLDGFDELRTLAGVERVAPRPAPVPPERQRRRETSVQVA